MSARWDNGRVAVSTEDAPEDPAEWPAWLLSQAADFAAAPMRWYLDQLGDA